MMKPEDIVNKIKEGLEFFRRRDFTNAEAILAHIIEIKPDSFYGWFHLGRTQYYLGKVEAAKNSFQQALRVNLELANSWLNKGKFCTESIGHDTDEACLAEYLYEHERDEEIRKILAQLFYDNRSLVTRDHCFDELAISEKNKLSEDDASQILFKRRNCHVTTH